MGNGVSFEDAIRQAANILRGAKRAVAFTGAGISTPSGIPDFRSSGTGAWVKVDPMRVASMTAFRHHPKDFFDWLRPLAQKSWDANPNPAHQALADLERLGVIRAVITQNIDGLHQRAGSCNVLEVHGSMRTCTCLVCRKSFPFDIFKDVFLNGGFPTCSHCASIVKPDIVLYEEMLPMDIWEEARRVCQEADVCIVVGSSLEVTPAAGLPYIALQNGARLVINTLSETFLDDQADVLLRFDVARVLPAVRDAL